MSGARPWLSRPSLAVIQLKPALEKVLNLAPDSLTKQIKLTQDLLELFIDYQIPSDLLCFDAAAAAGAHPTLRILDHGCLCRVWVD